MLGLEVPYYSGHEGKNVFKRVKQTFIKLLQIFF